MNWWTRYSPRVSRPAAPASVRKQCDSPTYRFGSSRLVEDLVLVHAAEGDLGGGDQAQVGVGDRVHLPGVRVRVAGHEADAFEHLDAGEVRRDDRREPGLHRRLHGVLHEGDFEQRGLVLEEVELLPGDLGAGLEVGEVERLAQGDVVLRLEVELPRLAELRDDLVRGRVGADRRRRVRHVRDEEQVGLQVALDELELGVDGADFFLRAWCSRP